MASSIQLLRSTNPQERPFAGNLLEGQPAANLHSSEPGLFFKTTDGSVVKFGPAAITSDGSPPNSTPQGSAGNSVGELWLDKSFNPPVLRVYDGAQWVDAGSGGGGGGGAGSFLRWIYVASGGETTLSGTSGGVLLEYTAGLEEVFVNGVLITRGADYSAVNGTSITNLAPLTAGDVVTVLSMNPLETVQLPGQVTLLRWTVLAAAGQTVLSGIDSSSQQLAYTPGFEEVYVNGAFLRRGIDYTATDGASIQIAAPLTEDDEVTVLAWSAFEVGELSIGTEDIEDEAVTTTKIKDGDVTTAKLEFGAVDDSKVSSSAEINSAKLAFLRNSANSVTRSVKTKLEDVISVKDFGAEGNGLVDDSFAFIAALAAAGTVFVPKGLYRCDSMIELNLGKAMILESGATIKRTTDTDNTDPVIWIKGAYASLRGEGHGSFIRSDNDSPRGVVRLGHKDDTESHDNVLYCQLSDLSIFGKQPYGNTVGDPDVCLYMNNPQIGGRASYFHSVHNVLFAYTNVGVWLRNNANANIMSHLQFLQIGGNDVGVTNAAIYINGAKENMISDFFVHFSPNSISLRLSDTATGTLLNRVVNWISEPGTGGTAQGMVVTSCGVGNYIEGALVGIVNDYGPAGSGFFGVNKRNTWTGINENYLGISSEIRTASPAIILNDTFTGGQKFSIVNGANTLRIRKTDNTDAWVWNSAGTMYPAVDNTTQLGAAAFRISEIFAANGTINTSDAREKTQPRDLTSAELAAAKDMCKEIGMYQFLSSLEKKGEAARHHVGMTVQRCIEIMESHGLDAFSYGFVCYDEWNATKEVLDPETGEIIAPATTTGSRYGFRTDQLLLFIARGFEERLTALEDVNK